MLFIGKAQEKYSAFPMIKKISGHTGKPYPWLMRSSVMCNQYYFYLLDEDFGPMFIKFGSYFPYTARVCINGHEYVKCQLRKEGIPFKALDNGVLSRENPERAQQILNEFDESKIEAVVAKWLARLPDPFMPEDHAAGFNYRSSILQAEFARTQVFDRPLSGWHLFEEVIRENLFLMTSDGFRNATMRQWMAQALGITFEEYGPGKMTYDLRRLRLHGLIERIPHTFRYQVTGLGLRAALFFTKVHGRVLRPGISQLMDGAPNSPNRPIANTMRDLDRAMDLLIDQAKLAPCET